MTLVELILSNLHTHKHTHEVTRPKEGEDWDLGFEEGKERTYTEIIEMITELKRVHE